MQFSGEAGLLLDTVKAVYRATSRKSTLPILAHVMLQAAEGRLTATATDLNVALSISSPVQVVEPGAVTLPARELRQVLETFAPTMTVLLRVEESRYGLRVTITCGEVTVTLFGLPADEFPQVMPVAVGVSVTFPSGVWPALLRKVSHAMHDDEIRRVLCGVHLYREEAAYVLTATDTHRLALATHQMDGPDVCVTLPREAVPLMAGMRGDEVAITVGEGTCDVRCGALWLHTRTIDGQYPDCRRVVPRDAPQRWIVERAYWLRALKRGVLLSAEGKVYHTVDNAGLIVRSESEDGHCRERLSLCTFGEEHETAFNAAYLIDMLARSTSETVAFYQANALAPCQVIDDDAGWVNVIMPMQTL